ncbi:hypothetical protein GCM10010965_32410 [Caldalkalibacillus thermarum]|nr:hypothetical protein GCM10010965_32410 [Caldalkalibacillus thermarum]
MQKLTTKIPTIKELEGLLFRKLQEQFSEGMRRILEALDDWIMEQRDTARFRLKDQREISIDTLFGTVRFKRRLYLDRKTGKHVFLLDRMMQYEGRDKLSPNLEELAIQFASEGPSYRDSAQRLEALLGYRVLSHEAIREKLIVQAERTEPSEGERRPVRVLFVEVDGLYTKLQRERRRGMENRIAVVHEGWESEGERSRLDREIYFILYPLHLYIGPVSCRSGAKAVYGTFAESMESDSKVIGFVRCRYVAGDPGGRSGNANCGRVAGGMEKVPGVFGTSSGTFER